MQTGTSVVPAQSIDLSTPNPTNAPQLAFTNDARPGIDFNSDYNTWQVWPAGTMVFQLTLTQPVRVLLTLNVCNVDAQGGTTGPFSILVNGTSIADDQTPPSLGFTPMVFQIPAALLTPGTNQVGISMQPVSAAPLWCNAILVEQIRPVTQGMMFNSATPQPGSNISFSQSSGGAAYDPARGAWVLPAGAIVGIALTPPAAVMTGALILTVSQAGSAPSGVVLTVNDVPIPAAGPAGNVPQGAAEFPLAVGQAQGQAGIGAQGGDGLVLAQAQLFGQAQATNPAVESATFSPAEIGNALLAGLKELGAKLDPLNLVGVNMTNILNVLSAEVTLSSPGWAKGCFALQSAITELLVGDGGLNPNALQPNTAATPVNGPPFPWSFGEGTLTMVQITGDVATTNNHGFLVYGGPNGAAYVIQTFVNAAVPLVQTFNATWLGQQLNIIAAGATGGGGWAAAYEGVFGTAPPNTVNIDGMTSYQMSTG